MKFRVGRFGIFLYIKGKNNYNKKCFARLKRYRNVSSTGETTGMKE